MFHYKYNSETLVATLTGLVVSFVFLTTPWVKIMKLRKVLKSANIVTSFRESNSCLGDIAQDIQTRSYLDYKHLFMKDYDRMNPMSARRAIQEWVIDIKNKKE